jgi:hypothetical protein
MARDLIPPPAPSWRALQPDGTPNLVELPPEKPSELEPSAPPPRHLPPSEHRNRFGFLGGALGGVILAAVAVFAIVITTNNAPSDEGLARNWSKWQPEETSMSGGPPEIATHVAPQYKLDDGTQLVNVTAGPLAIQSVPLDDVLIQSQDSSIHQLTGRAIMYTLSGLGPRGSIVGGTPSKERHRLVRREALELALYTFRYLPDVDMVVALLPPPKPADGETAQEAAQKNPPQAVFYRPGDLKGQLQVPLGNTVPAKAPTPDSIPPKEATTIDALTLSNLFVADFTQTQDLRAHLVLQRPKSG